MTDIAAWLLAQYDADEQVAKRAQVEVHGEVIRQTWAEQDWIELDPEVREHVDRHDPWLVLADLAAKRRIVELYQALIEVHGRANDDISHGMVEGLGHAVRLLASALSDREGYDPAWKPDA